MPILAKENKSNKLVVYYFYVLIIIPKLAILNFYKVLKKKLPGKVLTKGTPSVISSNTSRTNPQVK